MTTKLNDNRERRGYWKDQMEAAYAFMMEVMEYPVEECGEPLVDLRAAVDDAEVEVVFSDSKLAETFDRVFMLRQGLIEGFVGAGREMNDRGWVMKVEDGYRTIAMQQQIGRTPAVFDSVLTRVTWELDGVKPTPELVFRRLTVLTATYPKIGTHTSGSAVDISVLNREDGTEVDRGGPYIELSELTPMDSPFPSEQARQNRRAITDLMARHGFVTYPFEFWHYNANDAYGHILNKTGRPAPYGSVELVDKNGAVRPVANPKDPLHSPEDIQQAIEAAIARAERV